MTCKLCKIMLTLISFLSFLIAECTTRSSRSKNWKNQPGRRRSENAIKRTILYIYCSAFLLRLKSVLCVHPSPIYFSRSSLKKLYLSLIATHQKFLSSISDASHKIYLSRDSKQYGVNSRCMCITCLFR